MLRGKVGGSINGFMSFITSREAIAVASAVVLTTFVSNYILPLVGRIPVIGRNPTIALLAAAVIVFIIARFIGNGILRSVLLGVVAGMTINAILTTSFGRGIASRFGV